MTTGRSIDLQILHVISVSSEIAWLMHKQHLFVGAASVLWGCDIVAVLEVAWSKAAAIINWMAINSSRRQ